MSKKLYFQNEEDDEWAYSLQHHLDYMKENEIAEMEVFEAVIMRGSGFFYCHENNAVGDSSEKTCGKFCETYQPRNGKSGNCKNHGRVYEQGKSKILKL